MGIKIQEEQREKEEREERVRSHECVQEGKEVVRDGEKAKGGGKGERQRVLETACWRRRMSESRRQRQECRREQRRIELSPQLAALLISMDLTFENLRSLPPSQLTPIFSPSHPPTPSQPLTPSAVMCVNPALPLNRLKLLLGSKSPVETG